MSRVDTEVFCNGKSWDGMKWHSPLPEQRGDVEADVEGEKPKIYWYFMNHP